jgi:hypothetical protein
MNAYETSATVQGQGVVSVAGVPFQPGTQVRVIVAPKRTSGEEFARAWDEWCREIRNRPHAREITDDEIQKEIDDYRAGR